MTAAAGKRQAVAMHETPCAGLQVLGERVDNLEEWQARQNGSLKRLEQWAADSRLYLVALLLVTGSQHPLVGQVLKALGLG